MGADLLVSDDFTCFGEKLRELKSHIFYMMNRGAVIFYNFIMKYSI